ncbi:cupin domain-containing protein [Saccharopolyspora sp. WRP15-2]|uniref:Cupin domain-containing protein n=1 Tax=Saccharopolyspora oryzae TaxID=2997343 RepID=A0ABT4V4Q9_9PSEU|nr:cupin domain-containing protein [Saccharopolyspora oryzae]MDA3628955.1 cupin domain-containing protein [Saccharopolyspora oryzae]
MHIGLPGGDDPAVGRALIERLGLEPLEGEGGHVRKMYADENMSSAIYLMVAPDFSALHKLDSPEVYHWQGGAPVRMLVLDPDGTSRRVTLGPDLDAGQVLQVVVPAGAWQGSRPGGAWSLVGLTLSPPFRFEGFALGDRADLRRGWPEAADEIDALTR